MNRPGVGRDVKLSACPHSLQVGGSGTVELCGVFKVMEKAGGLSLPPSDKHWPDAERGSCS